MISQSCAAHSGSCIYEILVVNSGPLSSAPKLRKPMKIWVGITDNDWFDVHASKSKVDEVNFWKPSSQVGFRALQCGEPFLFKLKGRRLIGGGGFFTKFLRLPL